MRKPILAGLCLLMLQGCWASNAWLWLPYRKPVESSFRPTAAGADCPRVGVQNLTAQRAEVILDAVAQVCGIFASAEFERAVLAKGDWLASCARPGGVEDAISAAEVLAIVRGPKADFSVLARKPPAAIAQIDPPKARIAIRKLWFDYWLTGTVAQRSELVETVAHELTHFVKSDGELNFRFRDGGHGTAACPDSRLASYSVGAIAARIWRERQGG